MNETILQYWNKVKQYWQQLSRSQKLWIAGIVVVLIIFIVVVTYKTTRTEYAYAFTALAPADAAAITTYLKSAKIPYKLSTDGKSIGVPRKQAAQVKLAVESKGLNKSGSIGYGDFSTNNFGMTDQVFNVKFLAAVQGELEQLIGNIQGVNSSKVLITLPNNSVFLNDKNKNQSTASVVVQLKPGYTLTQGQINTMYNLVSHAVEQLPIQNITISDQNGNALDYSSSKTASSSGNMNDQMKVIDQFKQEIEKQVTSLLGRIYGKNNIIVSVLPTFNFDEKKSHQELVKPPDKANQSGLAISLENITKSTSSTGAPQAGGTAGTGTSSVPGYQSSSSSTGSSTDDESTKRENFVVDRITNDIVSTPYVMEDLTINVGIEPQSNSNAQVTKQMATSTQTFLENIVRTALADNGKTYTNTELANKVSVIVHQFAPNTQIIPSVSSPSNKWVYGGVGAGAVALMLMGGYFIAQRRKRREAILQAEQMEQADTQNDSSVNLESVSNENQVRRQIENLAKKKPEEFVDLLRSWLADE